jgi:RHS repeat-associated protein
MKRLGYLCLIVLFSNSLFAIHYNNILFSAFNKENKEFEEKKQENVDLHYFKARYYNADVGRFLSPDPHTLNTGNLDLKHPQTLNPYIYCINNPLKFYDPDGLLTRIITTNNMNTGMVYNASSGEQVSKYETNVYINGRHSGTFYFTRDPYGLEGRGIRQGEGTYGSWKEAPPGTFYASRYRNTRVLLSDRIGGTTIEGPDGTREYLEKHQQGNYAGGCLTTENIGNYLDAISEDLDNDIEGDVKETIVDRHNKINAVFQKAKFYIQVGWDAYRNRYDEYLNEDER